MALHRRHSNRLQHPPRWHTAPWSNWKRGQDYYQEGELLWLDADTLIRKLTDNKKSLNDFEAIFLGKGGNTGPLIVPYERPELIADLNQVRLRTTGPSSSTTASTTSIPTPTSPASSRAATSSSTKTSPPTSFRRRLMAALAADAAAAAASTAWYSDRPQRPCPTEPSADVRFHGPADQARLSPGLKIYAVNGRVYTPDSLKAALKAAKGNTEPIHLVLEQDGFVTMADINYHDGERYPTLVRVDGTPAYLDDITKPLTTSPAVDK